MAKLFEYTLACLSMIFMQKLVMRKVTSESGNDGTFVMCMLERSSELFAFRI